MKVADTPRAISIVAAGRRRARVCPLHRDEIANARRVQRLDDGLDAALFHFPEFKLLATGIVCRC